MSFPILSFSRDLIQVFFENIYSHYEKRNFLLCCKKIYNAIPSFLRRKHLFYLHDMHIRYTTSWGRVDGVGKKYCQDCHTRFKRRHWCLGLKQCHKCGGVFRPGAHGGCNWVKQMLPYYKSKPLGIE